MAEPPTVNVRVEDLKGETPVALRDSLTSVDLVIDFNWPPEVIAAGLQSVFREGIASGRWSRNRMGNHSEAPEQPNEVAPQPEGDLD